MKAPSQMSRTATLVEGALMVALAFALSAIPHLSLPLGGSISWFSTLPILMMSFRHNAKWGSATAAVYSLAQMLQGMDSITYVQTLGAMVLCALLDYILAYTCLGFAGPIARRFKNGTLGLALAVLLTGAMRYLCSFWSGIIVWGAYLDEGVNMWTHSLRYNALWCVPDVAIVFIAVMILSRVKLLHMTPQQEKVLV